MHTSIEMESFGNRSDDDQPLVSSSILGDDQQKEVATSSTFSRIWENCRYYKKYIMSGLLIAGGVFAGYSICLARKNENNTGISNSHTGSTHIPPYLNNHTIGSVYNNTLTDIEFQNLTDAINNHCSLNKREKEVLSESRDLLSFTVSEFGRDSVISFYKALYATNDKFAGYPEISNIYNVEKCDQFFCEARRKIGEKHFIDAHTVESINQFKLKVKSLGNLCNSQKRDVIALKEVAARKRFYEMEGALIKDLQQASQEPYLKDGKFFDSVVYVEDCHINILGSNVYNKMRKILKSSFESNCEIIIHTLEILSKYLDDGYFLKYKSNFDRKCIVFLLDEYLENISGYCKDYCHDIADVKVMFAGMQKVHAGVVNLSNVVVNMPETDLGPEFKVDSGYWEGDEECKLYFIDFPPYCFEMEDEKNEVNDTLHNTQASSAHTSSPQI
ncbi:MAG: hypothetical protein P857_948 [Candidatus Xenolissoclinum pacificiensis L6]|uniref:Uncharacterized protein n=1 Tax=Candidatus Xenolissoclinum pacificiensis L6 TaxID=1401685 RepID=W2V2W0_9RICK|nr:MAG: hypothetical protein P857_948 [Candidatus Xenolissoclinum pacificiensis L6]